MMKKLADNKKMNVYGGITQLAIFGVITAISVGVNLITNIAGSVLNAKSNAKTKKVEERKTFNVYYQDEPSIVTY